jgi:hypothetical protein
MMIWVQPNLQTVFPRTNDRMGLNRIIHMLTRMVSRRAMNWGINKGIDKIAKSGGKPAPVSAKQARDMRTAVKRARQAARLTRRIGR